MKLKPAQALVVFGLLLLSLAGVARADPMPPLASAPAPVVSDDPWEGFNRSMFSFNQGLDNWVLKPVTRAYRTVTPNWMQAGFSNFFNNLAEPWVMLNDGLQGEAAHAGRDLGRFVINTTVGLFGFIDIATPLGLERRKQDVGRTLARWGVGEGPYLVLPIFGPSTVRDGAGLGTRYWVDNQYNTNVLNLLDDEALRLSLLGLGVINQRSQLWDEIELLDRSGLDPYVVARNGYLTSRRQWLARIQGSSAAPPPPPELNYDEDFDEKPNPDKP